MDAIGLPYEYTDINDPRTLRTHVEYDEEDHPLLPSNRSVITICGMVMDKENAEWYDGLTSVNCPICLRIIRIGKSARIGGKRLDRYK